MDRETLGKAIYMAMYERQGAIWEANETKEVWYEIADRVIRNMTCAASPGKVEFVELEELILKEVARRWDTTVEGASILIRAAGKKPEEMLTKETIETLR